MRSPPPEGVYQRRRRRVSEACARRGLSGLGRVDRVGNNVLVDRAGHRLALCLSAKAGTLTGGKLFAMAFSEPHSEWRARYKEFNNR